MRQSSRHSSCTLCSTFTRDTLIRLPSQTHFSFKKNIFSGFHSSTLQFSGNECGGRQPILFVQVILISTCVPTIRSQKACIALTLGAKRYPLQALALNLAYAILGNKCVISPPDIHSIFLANIPEDEKKDRGADQPESCTRRIGEQGGAA